MSRIILDNLDAVRVVRNTDGQFVDINAGSTNDQSLEVKVFEMHTLVIKRKSNIIKTFIFKNNKVARDYVYDDYWKDAEVIFTNI